MKGLCLRDRHLPASIEKRQTSCCWRNTPNPQGTQQHGHLLPASSQRMKYIKFERPSENRPKLKRWGNLYRRVLGVLISLSRTTLQMIKIIHTAVWCTWYFKKITHLQCMWEQHTQMFNQGFLLPAMNNFSTSFQLSGCRKPLYLFTHAWSPLCGHCCLLNIILHKEICSNSKILECKPVQLWMRLCIAFFCIGTTISAREGFQSGIFVETKTCFSVIRVATWEWVSHSILHWRQCLGILTLQWILPPTFRVLTVSLIRKPQWNCIL